MGTNSCIWMIIFLVAVGTAAALENYADYGMPDESAASAAAAAASPSGDRSANLREIYRMLVQRSVDEPSLFRGLGIGEHLQPRAVERSPSLRLRFGRSYPKYPRSPSLRLRFGRSYMTPVGPMSRPDDGGSAAAAATPEEN